MKYFYNLKVWSGTFGQLVDYDIPILNNENLDFIISNPMRGFTIDC